MGQRRRSQWDSRVAARTLARVDPVPWDKVQTQAVPVDAQWWSAALADGGVVAKPLSVSRVEGGPTFLRRCDVWQCSCDVLNLLWHSLAWGSGKYRRMCHRRIASVAADPKRVEDLLKKAVEASKHDPVDAYRLLYPRGRSAIGGLGPAFGTKFLYFAGGGEALHPSLILDQRVASRLGLPNWGWSAETYGAYCALLEERRAAAGEESAAQWELALFQRE